MKRQSTDDKWKRLTQLAQQAPRETPVGEPPPGTAGRRDVWRSFLPEMRAYIPDHLRARFEHLVRRNERRFERLIRQREEIEAKEDPDGAR